MPKPILFFAFANAHDQYLRGLPEELRNIREALHAAEQANVCEIVERTNTSVKDIFDVFQDKRYAGRIAVMHYAGHAGDYKLLLETATGNAAANTDGLVPFLTRQKGLSLIFLNGCCTQLQGEELSAAGVPAVVCTYREIPDAMAQTLAARFYEGLGQGLTLEQSWLDAVDEAKTEMKPPSVSEKNELKKQPLSPQNPIVEPPIADNQQPLTNIEEAKTKRGMLEIPTDELEQKGYSGTWRQVEAVRKALFDSTSTDSHAYFSYTGRGSLRAIDALNLPPADASLLTMTHKLKHRFYP